MIDLKRILVATDLSEASDAALRYGLELARRFDASLHIIHVVDDLATHLQVPGAGADVPTLQKAIEDDARAALERLLPESEREAFHARVTIAASSSPGHAILEYASAETVDLVIVGTHGRHSLSHFFLGSVAQQVSRLADCPVLSVRSHERDFVKLEGASS
jgi:nucleotide-binding universal stress UspA family protein